MASNWTEWRHQFIKREKQNKRNMALLVELTWEVDLFHSYFQKISIDIIMIRIMCWSVYFIELFLSWFVLSLITKECLDGPWLAKGVWAGWSLCVSIWGLKMGPHGKKKNNNLPPIFPDISANIAAHLAKD